MPKLRGAAIAKRPKIGTLHFEPREERTRDGTKDLGYMKLAAAILTDARDTATDPKLPNTGNVPETEEARREYLEEARDDARLFLQSDMWPWCEFLDLDVFSDSTFREWCRRNEIEPGVFLAQPLETLAEREEAAA